MLYYNQKEGNLQEKGETTMKNLYLGNHMLGIRYEDGRWVVKEDYEDWAVVFSGTYEECVAYCEERWVSYQAEIMG